MPEKIPVGVLGATGTVGQRFIERLARHPWFELAAVAASDRSQGKPYGEATRWRLPSALPGDIAGMRVSGVGPELPCRIVFSALEASVAREVEPRCAEAGQWVFSNASAHRMDEDVPLLIPEVNPESLQLLDCQRRRRGWRGALITNANCSTIFLAMALHPLHRAFGVSDVLVTTMQAVSGAGYPGVASLDILGNVIPDIPHEAEKIQRETVKILGTLHDGAIRAAPIAISAMTHRVPVEEGHLEAVSAALLRPAGQVELQREWEDFRAPDDVRGLPSAPGRPIVYLRDADRPQPRRDAEVEQGMATVVGGLRPCAVLHWKFSVLGHNTIRGAAGASLLNAEYAVARGILD